MAKFDLNDSGVVVIVGSGAGGGTLGNELAQKGVKVVILEAGARIENQDFVNDEWESFTQLAWSDMRTTSGSWRVGALSQPAAEADVAGAPEPSAPDGGDTAAPTTLLVDGGGTVRWTFRPDRFLNRLSPSQVLAAVDKEMPAD